MEEKTLGQAAYEAYHGTLCRNAEESWKAVADAVVAEYEARQWKDDGWQELQFAPTRWPGAGASIGKWKNGKWLVAHGITFASTAHEMGFTHFCTPLLPAPPKEGE